MPRALPRPNHASVVAYLALFLALAGGAYAIHSTAPPTIRACYSSRTGALRVLRAAHCGRGEQFVAWNQRGIAGPAGAPGPQGLQGPTGTVDTANFYTKSQSDTRYLPVAGIAANSSELGGQAPSAFAASSLFGSPTSVTGGGAGDPYCVLGEIKLTATGGASLPTNWTLAHGQSVSIASNTALFSLLGTTYGGNGTTTFALPDLRGAEPKGASPSGVNYAICTTGVFP
jgi:Phage Tail Collar Domain